MRLVHAMGSVAAYPLLMERTY